MQEPRRAAALRVPNDVGLSVRRNRQQQRRELCAIIEKEGLQMEVK